MILSIILLVIFYFLITFYIRNQYLAENGKKAAWGIGLSWWLIVFIELYSYITHKLFLLDFDLKIVNYNVVMQVKDVDKEKVH
jgi:hypothetical protein